MISRRILMVFLIPVAVLAGEPQHAGKVVLQSTVTGNLEQPKVLYILPWQNAKKIAFDHPPMSAIAKKVFSVIDKEEFQREVGFRRLAAKQKVIEQKDPKR